MTKEKLDEYRENIYGLRLEIYQIIESANVMRSSAMRTTTQLTDEPRGGNQTQDKMAEIVCRVVDKESKVAHLMVIQDEYIKEIEQAIAYMRPRNRAIFRSYYVECLSCKSISQLMNCSVSYIKKIKNEEIEKMIPNDTR